MILTKIVKLGRFRNILTGKEVNLKKGTKVGYGVDLIFYLNRGKRMFISDHEFYKYWFKV